MTEAVTAVTKTAYDHKEYWYRRIHSLTGVLPLSLFLVVHFLGNMESTMRDNGASFDEYATKLHDSPIINILEIGVIVPLLFHGVYGLYRVATREKWNTFQVRNESNMRYFLQRVTGVFLFVFIGLHIYMTRWQQLMGTHVDYAYMVEHLSAPIFFVLYVLGVASACYHWANGIWGFLISWGVTTGRKSQDISAKVCLLAGVGLFLFGMNSLLGFFDSGISFNF